MISEMQIHTIARQMIEKHGFEAVRFTDGQDNEEKVPDIRYRWARLPR